MRHSDREIKDIKIISEFLDSCDTIRVGLFDDEYPYVVPMSFGYELIEDKLYIYLHGAKVGKKLDLIKKNKKVCVEADVFCGYKPTPMGLSVDYQSVIGYGHINIVEKEEQIKGLELLLKHCKAQGYSAKECANSNIVNVYKITVDKISGKKRF